MLNVLFGDDQGETFYESFETIEEANEFANMDIRKLTILEVKEQED